MTRYTYVYLIASQSGHLKIGVASSVHKRLASLQGGNPYKLTVVAAERLRSRDLAFRVEQCVHGALSGGRVRGEWFSCDVGTAERVMRDAVEHVMGGYE